MDVSCGFDVCFECKVLLVGVPPLESGGCAFESRSSSPCACYWSLDSGVLVGDAPLGVVCIAMCNGDVSPICCPHVFLTLKP